MLSTAGRALAVIVLVAALPATVHTQATDVVEVSNGDRFTGEVRRLQRGELTFRTPAASTITIAWREVVHLTSKETFDVELISGERFTGSISSPSAGAIVVQTASGPARPIGMKEIAWITPVAAGFRGRTTGSVDFGVSFTHAENARTYTLDAAAEHRSRSHAYETEVSFNSWLAARDDAERLTRNDVAVGVRKRLPQRWFAVGMFEAQQDEQLELDVRLLAGAGVGRRLVQSNRTHLLVQGGLDYDGERYNDVGSFEHSAEAFAGVDWDWFAPGATEAALVATTFISLARERVRLEWDATVRRDVFWSMYWALNVFDSVDSDPPADRPRTNLGAAFTLGWTF